MKQLLLIVLVLLPVVANADESGTCGSKVSWNFNSSTHVLTISGTGDMAFFNEAYNTPWYSFKSEIKSVIIGNGVTSIGRYAFAFCSNITSIDIPNSVTTIGISAFYNCRNLTDIIIPQKVKEIPGWAFDGCTSLPSIIIPDNVTTIGESAFWACHSLSTLVIGNSVTSIGESAFGHCDKLLSITIPKSVDVIGQWAFSSCQQLSNVYCLAENVPSMKDSNNNPCTNAFLGVSIENATLHVPASSVNSYRMTAPWSSFGTIKAIGDYYTLSIYSSKGGQVLFNTQVITDNLQDFYVESGEQVVLTFVSDENYIIETVKVNGLEVDVTNNTYTIENMSEDVTVEVAFKYSKTSVEITMANNISTSCSDKGLDFTNVPNLKAYIASGISPSTGEVLLTRVYKVPAGEGLVLKGNAGEYEVPYAETDMFYTNLLVGVTRATTISPTEGRYTNFILANGSHGIGFYTLSEAGEIAAGKAYLQLPTSAISSGGRGIKMRFDDEESNPTAVSEVENQQPNESEYYDMQGRKVRSGAARKGMYIIRNANGSNQGKKLFIR